MQVILNGSPVNISPSQSIGSGGEADIYLLPNDKALKVYKPSNHPDYHGRPDQQKAAAERLREHQVKLPAFPKGLPPRVVVPEELANDRRGLIVGYVMRLISGAEALLRYGERSFRQTGVSNDMVVQIFLDLHTTVSGIHQARVVIGDFNDLNVLVLGSQAYLIDADSFQFDRFMCRLFTTRFVDPLLCNPQETRPILYRPYGPESDWYAFLVMLVRSLLYVDPYGGIYIPKEPAKRLLESARPLHRITFFHPEVRYPKPAVHFSVLPDDLLQYLHLVLEKDQRSGFPRLLLENLRWTKCTECGTEHARSFCPSCAHVPEVAVKAVTTVRGNVTATRIFRTSGVILFATLQEGRLRWLYHENDRFLREDESAVLQGTLDPQVRYRIQKDATLIGRGNTLVTLRPGEPLQRLNIEAFGTLPIFDANSARRYWAQGGQLWRDGNFGPAYIGDVLSNQTLFWVGEKFGFGFYRAGNVSRAFVFDAERPGINDTVKLDPPLRGQLVDSTCVFAKEQCWFLVATQQGGVTTHHCYLTRSNGSVEATAQVERGDPSWLGTLRGKYAYRNFLLAATDEGIVRVEANNGQLTVTSRFPDSEPFVDAGSHLFLGDRQDLYVVGAHEIKILRIA